VPSAINFFIIGCQKGKVTSGYAYYTSQVQYIKIYTYVIQRRDSLVFLKRNPRKPHLLLAFSPWFCQGFHLGFGQWRFICSSFWQVLLF
jgi:hypothetical protein